MAIISDDNLKYGGEKPSKASIKKNPNIKSEAIEFDKTFENTIRPKDFDSYIGQSELKETLKIIIRLTRRKR